MREASFAATIDQTEVVLDLSGRFSIKLPFERTVQDVYLVIDIYELDHSVHPEGHVGWWRFEIADLPETLDGTLVRQPDGRIALEMDRAHPTDHWHNPNVPRADRLELLVVMRSSLTSAILSIDRAPVLQSVSDLDRFRGKADRGFQHARYVSCAKEWPTGSTVHIVSKSIFERDAVGNLCLALYGLIKQQGASARLYADEFSLTMNDIVHRRSILKDTVGPDDTVLYHFSTYDDRLEQFAELRCRRRIVYYHGVTSPQLLQVFDTEMSAQCAKALRQLPLLTRFDEIATNSAANAADLRARLAAAEAPEIGRIGVIPPKVLCEQDIALASAETDAGARNGFLYVGRIRSHKRIEDILHLFAYYRALEPDATCTIIGSVASSAYGDYLQWFQTRQLKLPAGAVNWLGEVSPAELEQAYRKASIYVSMSEDEGFCLPILEAMMHDNMVFAYDVPAVRELLGGSGVIFSQKSFAGLASEIYRILGSERQRREIATRQRQRAKDIALNMNGRHFIDLLTETTAKRIEQDS